MLSLWEYIPSEPDRGITFRCEFFDGYKCPNVLEPGKYPYLLSQKAIDDTREAYGENSPQFQSQRRGFFPAEGLERTLFTPTLFDATKSYDPVIWKFEATPVAGLDPAFSSGGDRCVLQFANWGPDSDGIHRLALGDTVVIPLVAGGEKPMSMMICDSVKTECEKRGVIPENLGMDCTGAQITLADMLDIALKGHIHRVNFSGKASDLPLSANVDTPAREMCRNRVTELWAAFHAFVKSHMVRQLSEEAVPEFCARRLTGSLHPMQVEPKTIMKQRFGASPDIADAHAVITDLLRERFGVVATRVADTSVGGTADFDRLCVQADVDSSDGSYLQSWDSADMLLY